MWSSEKVPKLEMEKKQAPISQLTMLYTIVNVSDLRENRVVSKICWFWVKDSAMKQKLQQFVSKRFLKGCYRCVLLLALMRIRGVKTAKQGLRNYEESIATTFSRKWRWRIVFFIFPSFGKTSWVPSISFAPFHPWRCCSAFGHIILPCFSLSRLPIIFQPFIIFRLTPPHSNSGSTGQTGIWIFYMWFWLMFVPFLIPSSSLQVHGCSSQQYDVERCAAAAVGDRLLRDRKCGKFPATLWFYCCSHDRQGLNCASTRSQLLSHF